MSVFARHHANVALDDVALQSVTGGIALSPYLNPDDWGPGPAILPNGYGPGPVIPLGDLGPGPAIPPNGIGPGFGVQPTVSQGIVNVPNGPVLSGG